MRRLIGATAPGLAAALLGLPARADTCGPAPGIDVALPADGSVVDRAAWVTVRYGLEDAPAGDAPAVTLRDAGGEPVAAAVSWDGREVVLVPEEPLAAEASYMVTAERPGRDAHTFGFVTSAQIEGPAAPVLGPSLDASFEYLGGGPEGDDPCGPIGFERYRVHLRFPAASGTSGPENVMYLAFQTRGAGVSDPLEVARAADDSGGDEVRLDLYRPANGVNGRACFRVLATDVTGPPSGTTDEACVRLEEGPFFVSLCRAAAGTSRRGGGAGALVVAAALALGRGRRPRAAGRGARGAAKRPRRG